MGEVRNYPTGTFCWVDLSTPDVASASGFYADLFGWETDTGADGYVTCRLDGKPVAGIFGGDHPGWVSHIAVEDLDDSLEHVKRLEGKVTSEPVEIPGSGRSALIEDPPGATVGLWEAAGHIGAQVVNENHTWTWNELTTPLVVRARDFYNHLFGWEADEITDDTPRITLRKGGLMIGGLHYPAPDEPHEARWTVTFRCESVDGDTEKASKLGAQTLLPPREIPIGKMAILSDPIGGVFIITSFEAPWQGVDSL